MKKILFVALVAALTFGITTMPVADVKAQSTNTVSKTITAADTITWTTVASKLKGLQYTYTETSGTTAGKVYLQGTINGTYVNLDSLTLSDVTTAQTKVFAITSTTYKGYRFVNTNTSSATGAVVATYIRRYDE